MSQALTVIQPASLAVGGIGLKSRLFRAKPATIELVQKTTHQEGAEPGRFRNTATKEHFDEMRIVLLGEPQEAREWWKQGTTTFSKEHKLCFSTDNVQPHPRAKQPPAMMCAICPKGDINWQRWRVTKQNQDLPPCQMYYHLVIADRATQQIYFFNAKGKSVTAFQKGMNEVSRLLQLMETNVKIENRRIDAENKAAMAAYNALVATIPDGQEKPVAPELKQFKPIPNVWDVSFVIYAYLDKNSNSYVLGIKDAAAVKEEDRAEFGNLFLEYRSRIEEMQALRDQQEAAAAQMEEAAKNAVVSGQGIPQEQPSAPPQVASPIPTGPVVGEVLPPEKITI